MFSQHIAQADQGLRFRFLQTGFRRAGQRTFDLLIAASACRRGASTMNAIARNLENAVAVEFGEHATDRLDGQAEMVGNVLPRHRERDEIEAARAAVQLLLQAEDEAGDPLDGAPASEIGDNAAACARSSRLVMSCRRRIGDGCFATKRSNWPRSKRQAVTGVRASALKDCGRRRHTDEFAGNGEADHQTAAVRQDAGETHDAFGDVGRRCRPAYPAPASGCAVRSRSVASAIRVPPPPCRPARAHREGTDLAFAAAQHMTAHVQGVGRFEPFVIGQ